MLAYVFWHAVADGIATDEYEKTLLYFGRALASAKIPGLLGNASYAINQTPWLGEPGYEDWAWLESSASLDTLNERAVAGAMEQPHSAVAQMTKHGGFGGLYCLVAGNHKIPVDSKVMWLSRPRGINWREITPTIMQSANSEVAVWRRQMVLGPAAEFAVIGPSDLSLAVPQGWKCLQVDRRRLGRYQPTD
jgi:hypothetical protein